MMEGISPYTPEERATLDKGQEIYTQVCFACHGDDGRGAKVPGAQNEALLGPPLASSPRVLGHQDYVVKTVLHGLTGPLDGKTYPDVMIGMGQNSDEWVAAISSYIRNSFGNRGVMISAADVTRVRAATARSKDDVDDCGARSVAATADRRGSDVEADRQPQFRDGHQCGEHQPLDVWPTAADRDVAAGGVAATGNHFRDSVRVHGRGRRGGPCCARSADADRDRPRRSTCRRRARLPTRISGPGVDGRRRVGFTCRRGPGFRCPDPDSVRADEGEVRANHADRKHRERASPLNPPAAVVHAGDTQPGHSTLSVPERSARPSLGAISGAGDVARQDEIPQISTRRPDISGPAFLSVCTQNVPRRAALAAGTVTVRVSPVTVTIDCPG